MIQVLAGHPFTRITAIQPDSDVYGVVRRLMPEPADKNLRDKPLNPYGAGPFCRFRISPAHSIEGVYALLVNGVVRYIGECQDLSKRFNTGYGQIYDINRYEGGRNTNCKVNRLIRHAAERRDAIDLWFLETTNRKNIEKELIARLKPEWNGSRIVIS